MKTDKINETTKTVTTTMRTDLLSEVLTEHKKKLGALYPNKKFTVTEIHGDDKVTVAEGYITDENS